VTLSERLMSGDRFFERAMRDFELLICLDKRLLASFQIVGNGHRIVHGGDCKTRARKEKSSLASLGKKVLP
jgi:hypothetical protein